MSDPAGAGAAYEARHDAARRAVFAEARAGRKIDAGRVVAGSRLYTPAHIVEFLLQNSLGALWLAMHPGSAVGKDWRYLVADAPAAPRPARPVRSLRLLDPCCGCGAFLLPAYDMFARLYEAERELVAVGGAPGDWAVEADEVPATILGHNIVGADLDADAVAISAELLRERAGVDVTPDLTVARGCLGALDPELWAGQQFDVICANPPYVGFRLMDIELKAAIKEAVPFAASDLAVAFQSRCFGLLAEGGQCATVTPAAWLTGREALPLREHILREGTPRIAGALGQRVFRRAPLVFVGVSVVARGDGGDHLATFQTGGPDADALECGVRAVRRVRRETITRLDLCPFLPQAPDAVLALASRGPRVGDLFRSFDGVWTGNTPGDTRWWWECEPNDPAWAPVSGGQGNEPWFAATRLRLPAHLAASLPDRTGCVEYPRVAGGRLAARVCATGTGAVAGIVTLQPIAAEAADRVEELLAIFNSRIGTAWLRTLSSGLNFNPGYAARIPLAADAPAAVLRQLVHHVIALRTEVVCGDPTADTFVDTPSPWQRESAPDPEHAGSGPGRQMRHVGQVREIEARLEAAVARHLGLDDGVLDQMDPVRRPVRRVDPVADHLMVRAMRILGFRWPSERVAPVVSERFVRSGWMSVGELAERLEALLASEGVEDPGVDVGAWVGQSFVPHHERRFRRRPVVIADGASRFRIGHG